jgi:hypothetical protein
MREEKKVKLYLYLAKRDKREIKILTTFFGNKIPPTKIHDVRKIGLPREMTNRLYQIIYDDRLLWEPWIESAESFDELKSSLKNRGYKAPRKCNKRFHYDEFLSNEVKSIDKVVISSRTKTNRIPLRKTMLGN